MKGSKKNISHTSIETDILEFKSNIIRNEHYPSFFFNLIIL